MEKKKRDESTKTSAGRRPQGFFENLDFYYFISKSGTLEKLLGATSQTGKSMPCWHITVKIEALLRI